MQCDQIVQHIADWLQKKCVGSGREGFVIGISGGIDSAVTSALCAKTGLPTYAVLLPIHQREEEVRRGLEHCRWLEKHFANVEHTSVDLTTAFDTLAATLPDDCRTDYVLANARSRLRMTTLYALAGGRSYVVCGTGNRVEDFGVGFFTKYGDGGVDLSPIADLSKTDVYAVAAELGIVESIREAVPTDGLWPDGRTDERQMGASYTEVEWAMDFAGDESELTERQIEVLAIFRRLHDANKHKLNPIPVCVVPPELR